MAASQAAAARAVEAAAPIVVAPEPALQPAPGCGEPTTRAGTLPVALQGTPRVLADAVIRVGEELELADAVIAAELRAPPMWFGEGPPIPSPRLIYRRDRDERAFDGFAPFGLTVVDDRRIAHRWSAEQDAAWIRVTDNACPTEHEQEARPGPGAPLWTWLSTRGLGQAEFGHNHTSKLKMRLWQSPEGPYLSFDQNVLASRANLSGGVLLRAGAMEELTLGPATVVIEEVILGAAEPHRGAALGEAAHPEVHVRVRLEQAEPPSGPTFPPGEVGPADSPCGEPSSRWPSRLPPMRAPTPIGARALVAGDVLEAPGIEVRLEHEPIPWLLDEVRADARPTTRPLVIAAFPGEPARAPERSRRFPWTVRGGDTIARITPAPDDDATMRVELHEVSCPPTYRGPLPSEATLIWLGAGGHTEVILGDEGDEGGEAARFEFREDESGLPKVLISTRSPEHGARWLDFQVHPESPPVVLDAGAAWIFGSWELYALPDPEDREQPRWYAVALPYVPKTSR
ncbi:MAG: hypothetical protein R3B09_06715 [Nannocystaceae bacterium]